MVAKVGGTDFDTRLLLEVRDNLLVKVLHGHRGEIPQLLQELMGRRRNLGEFDQVEYLKSFINDLRLFQNERSTDENREKFRYMITISHLVSSKLSHRTISTMHY